MLVPVDLMDMIAEYIHAEVQFHWSMHVCRLKALPLFPPTEHAIEILCHPASEQPGLLVEAFFRFDTKNRGEPGQQVGLRTHEMLEFSLRNVGAVEIFRIRPGANDGSRAPSEFLAPRTLQRLNDVAHDIEAIVLKNRQGGEGMAKLWMHAACAAVRNRGY